MYTVCKGRVYLGSAGQGLSFMLCFPCEDSKLIISKANKPLHVQMYLWDLRNIHVCRQRKPRSACVFAKSDQNLRCVHTDSLDIVEYIDAQEWFLLDCATAC